MKLKEFLIKTGKEYGLNGSDKSFIDFALMIIDNQFRHNETCINELKENNCQKCKQWENCKAYDPTDNFLYNCHQFIYDKEVEQFFIKNK